MHVPFCATRCGYCDFNTYTAVELGGGASQAAYADSVALEVALARRVLGGTELPLETVFFGGGTPTLLPPDDLAQILGGLVDTFGLAEGAEVTTEANPDSVDAAGLARLRAAGFTRISFGMQSAVPHVLAVLDRTHDPERVPQVVEWARAAGFEGVSLDLIYGTPGETLDDWRESLEAVVATGVDHVSAYALVVEEGTRLATRVRRGEVAATDEDDLADKYALADELLDAAGYRWYEVSNWAREPASSRRGTTSATGVATTGGGSGRAPTRTSAARAGGTCGTPRRGRRASPPERVLPRRVRCWATSSATRSRCSSRSVLPTGCRRRRSMLRASQ